MKTRSESSRINPKAQSASRSIRMKAVEMKERGESSSRMKPKAFNTAQGASGSIRRSIRIKAAEFQAFINTAQGASGSIRRSIRIKAAEFKKARGESSRMKPKAVNTAKRASASTIKKAVEIKKERGESPSVKPKAFNTAKRASASTIKKAVEIKKERGESSRVKPKASNTAQGASRSIRMKAVGIKKERGESSRVKPKASNTAKRASASTRTKAVEIKKERGESSSVKDKAFCKICMEHTLASATFFNPKCSHAFCHNCLSKYIVAMIERNTSAVKCPEDDCMGLLEPELCQAIIPKEVFDKWGAALCEAMILSSKKFVYCPFKDCSALLLADDEEARVAQSECPSCWRLFCATCKVAWHSGVSCKEFKRQEVDRVEELKLIEIAKSNKWMRCPNCKFYVEKTYGCVHVTCRCKCEFCYRCGKQWSDTHDACCIVRA